MLKFPIKVVLSILIFTLSSVVWAKHPYVQEKQLGVPLLPPFEAKPSLNFLGWDWDIQIQIGANVGVNVSVSNPYSLPLLPGLPFRQIEQAGCVPIPLPLSIFQLGIHSFGGDITQTSCMPIQATPEPEPPAPKPSKIQPQQVVDFPDDQSDCHLTDAYQEKHPFPCKNSSCRDNFIKTDKNVYYQGDSMRIGIDVEFLRCLKTIAKHKFDPYVLVLSPEGDIITIPVQLPKVGNWYKLIELVRIDTSDFVEGNYQIALVLTKSGGNPIFFDDWDNAFQGLISTTRVKIRWGYQYDVEDSDGNGIIDGDFNRDGFCEVYTNFHRRRGSHIWGKPACKKELIFSNQHVYYPGDTISLCLDPYALKSMFKSGADAYLVITTPTDDIMVMPVPVDEIDGLCPFWELDNLDTSAFAVGNYQIALVLTKSNSDDVLDINNWYQGFRGLVAVTRLKFSTGCDPEDIDGDREIDGDTDNDGISDETFDDEELLQDKESLEDDKSNDTMIEKPDNNSSDNLDDKQVAKPEQEPVKTPIKPLEQPIWPIEPVRVPEKTSSEEKPIEEPVEKPVVQPKTPIENSTNESPVVVKPPINMPDEEQPVDVDDEESVVDNEIESEEESDDEGKFEPEESFEGYDDEGRFEDEGIFEEDFYEGEYEGEFYEGEFED